MTRYGPLSAAGCAATTAPAAIAATATSTSERARVCGVNVIETSRRHCTCVAECGPDADGRAASDVTHQGLEPVIHVLLHVTVNERVTRVVGNDVHLDDAVARHVDGVLDQARDRHVADLHDVEQVAMEMERVPVLHAVL